MLEILVILGLLVAAVALAGFTARTAMERGRSGAAWATASAAAAIVVEGVAAAAFGRSVYGDVTGDMGGVFLAMLASLLGPFAAMGLVHLALLRLPERVPDLAGECWRMYRMSTKDAPGAECELAFEPGWLRLGVERIDAEAITAIATDGECLRIAWADQSLLLLPVGQERTARMRGKQSQAIARRLTRLLGRA